MFLSGAYYQGQCKWNLDNRYPIRKWRTPFELSTGDSVFLKVCDIPHFLAMRLTKKVALVVHNSDESFTEQLYRAVEPYVTRVSAVNCVTPLATQLPLGLRDHQYASHHVLRAVMSEPQPERTILCLVNFLIDTNRPEREAVYTEFKNDPLCTVQHEYMHYPLGKSLNFSDSETQQRRLNFYRDVKRSKYILCPAGTGLDTHRVYEAILLGATPIVRSSPLDPLYSTMPVRIVQEWKDVRNILHSEHK